MVHSILTSEIRTSATRSIRRYNAYHHVSEKFFQVVANGYDGEQRELEVEAHSVSEASAKAAHILAGELFSVDYMEVYQPEFGISIES